MPFGPADLYVVELHSDSVVAALAAVLRDVTTVGVITLLDVALVRRRTDGSQEAVELDEFADDLGMVGVMPKAVGLLGLQDLLARCASLPCGSSCLVVLMENTWARRFTKAVADADAHLIEVERLPADAVIGMAAVTSGRRRR